MGIDFTDHGGSVLITEVLEGGWGERNGFLVGDAIMEFAGEDFCSANKAERLDLLRR